MKRLSLKIAFALCFIMSSLVVYAIDPLGSKVDFDDDYNNSNLSFEGVAFLLVIVIIGIAIYLLYLKFRDYQEQKFKKKTIKMNSAEWIKQRNEEYANQIERQLKEGKESRKGCIFGAILFGGGIIWSIIQTDTEWLDAGKDLLVTFGGLAVLVGIVWLIGRITND